MKKSDFQGIIGALTSIVDAFDTSKTQAELNEKLFGPPEKHGFVPYDTMVSNLFKKLPGIQMECHHATTGICGEVAELLASTGRKNMLEELGDLRFYCRALRLKLSPIAEQINETREVLESPYYAPSYANVLMNMVILAGTLLDLTKKPWIYFDNPKKSDVKEYELHQQLALFEINFYFYTQVMGFTIEEIEYGNQVKLLGTPEQKGRYATGVYSNEQAQARADKNHGTDA